MSDVYDRASDLEQWHRDQAMARQAAKTPQVAAEDWDRLSAKWCEGWCCGERIPDERRRAMPGVRLCVECAGGIEQTMRMRR